MFVNVLGLGEIARYNVVCLVGHPCMVSESQTLGKNVTMKLENDLFDSLIKPLPTEHCTTEADLRSF